MSGCLGMGLSALFLLGSHDAVVKAFGFAVSKKKIKY
jgi:hypothetical protein